MRKSGEVLAPLIVGIIIGILCLYVMNNIGDFTTIPAYDIQQTSDNP